MISIFFFFFFVRMFFENIAQILLTDDFSMFILLIFSLYILQELLLDTPSSLKPVLAKDQNTFLQKFLYISVEYIYT